MGVLRVLMPLVVGGCMAVVAIGGTGCEGQGAGHVSPPAEIGALPWPPPDDPARMASDDVVVLPGKEFSANGGGTAVSGDNLVFTPGDSLPYAIYTLQGFGQGIEVGGVGVSFTLTEGTPGDGTALYVGASDYARGVWEWHKATPLDWDNLLADGTDYRSPKGRVSIAVILSGGGSASLNEVRFARSGATDFAAPENLTAEASVYWIDLDWDDVPGALGYNIYRALAPDFANPVKVNSKLLDASDYRDRGLKNNVMYYYRVTAVAGVRESAPSSMVDIFSPVVNSPLPTDCKLTGNGRCTADISWSYPETGLVSCFEILLSEVKDFNLEMLTAQYYPDANKRTFTLKRLKYQHKYYWRIVALDPLYRRGRMTDDISAGEPLKPTWRWFPVEDLGIGAGSSLTLIEQGGDLSAAYFGGGPDYKDLCFARRNNGDWTAEATGVRTYGTWMDMAYGGGNYVIYYYAFGTSGALGAVIGNPGNWTLETVSDVSGQYCRAAANDDEYAVIYYYHYEDWEAKPPIILNDIVIRTRPVAGGSWTRSVIRSDVTAIPMHHSIAYDAGDLCVLSMNYPGHHLLFGKRSNGYGLSDIADGGGADIGAFNDLTRVGSTWFTPAADETNHKLYVISGDGTNWLSTEVASSEARTGEMARMAPWKDDSVVMIYRDEAPGGGWNFAALGLGKWDVSPLLIADTWLTTTMDVACIGDTPYILFEDRVHDPHRIKCAMGTPSDI